MPKSEDNLILLFDSRIDIDTSGAVELEDGSARLEVRLAPKGEKFINGPWEFDITDDSVRQAIANFNKRGGPVAVTIGHYPDEDRQKQPAAAWIEALHEKMIAGQEYLTATMRFLKDTWTAIKEDKFKFLSMEFWPEDHDIKGNAIGFNLDGAAILNYPAFPLRFDQSRSRGGILVTCARLSAGGGKVPSPKKKVYTMEIREVDGQFCIYDEAGEKKSCHPTREAAEAAMGGEPKKEPVSLDAGLEIRQVGEEFCIFNAAGEKLGCHPTREAAEAAMAGMAGPAQQPAPQQVPAGKVLIDKTEHARLVKLARGSGDDPEKIALRSRVKALEDDAKKGKRRDLASRVRNAVNTIIHEHKRHIRLGDFNLRKDDEAIKFLESRPMGITTIDGLESLAESEDACAHLPHVKLGEEVDAGVTGMAGEPDLTTADGRKQAVEKRIATLKKEFGEDEFNGFLRARHETAHEFARKELKNEHPKIKWDAD